MRIVLILIVAAVAAAVVSVLMDRQKMKDNAKALGLTEEDRVIDCVGPMLRFAVKWAEGNAYAVTDIRARPTRIPLASITGCEFTEGDGQRSSTIGQALVGGAVMDALDGKAGRSILRICLEGQEQSTVEYRLMKTTYAEDFRRFAQEVSGLIDEIMEKNGEA